MTRRWLVALSEKRQQEIARAEVERRGIKTYFPMTKKVVVNRFTARSEKIPDYYFGNYFFVEFTPNWIDDVMRARGVANVLHRDELSPAPEASNMIEHYEKVPRLVSDRDLYLKVRSHEVNGYIPLKRGLKRGQRVKVTSGAMKGRTGTFEQDLGHSRMAALFDFIGKDTHISIPTRSVIAVLKETV
jgi:transcription antitermination factor NusG